MVPIPPTWTLDALRAVMQRHWGFHEFRPLQLEAMKAVLDRRDSLVVMPTGGGKSLCFQAPSVLMGSTTLVVSPLIALMKDQVDALRACGVPAAQLDSSQTPAERSACEADLRRGALRLLYVSPERLVQTGLPRLLQQLDVRTIVIDEAHCISHWGHDFRPEYRQLQQLREQLPHASVHAYTATATGQVRRDICTQLGLQDPELLVGNFDRANLTYRVVARRDLSAQVAEVLERHRDEAGIIYCIRRRDVDDLADLLSRRGHAALAYHAGLQPHERRSVQEAFTAEKCDIVVATVAFGMGINRSNIRFVLHTAMPKSIEHYQQETGRAGRDGLEAECVLLYSGADTLLWKSIVEKSAEEAGAEPAFVSSALRHLDDMDRYSRGAVCRHKALVEYFGQSHPVESCGACDLCLGETQVVAEANVVAQKILSCVARVKERFGIGHVIDVLRGSATEKVQKFGHAQLSTFGLLKEYGKPELRDWLYQLIGQGVLVQEDLPVGAGTVPILRLNDASWEVMRSQRSVRLVQPVRRKKGEGAKKSAVAEVSWAGVDRDLFEELRRQRRLMASERQCPPYLIFSDATLRELARVRPTSPQVMRQVYGVGDAKLQAFGEHFLQVLRDYCREQGLETDVTRAPPL